MCDVVWCGVVFMLSCLVLSCLVPSRLLSCPVPSRRVSSYLCLDVLVSSDLPFPSLVPSLSSPLLLTAYPFLAYTYPLQHRSCRTSRRRRRFGHPPVPHVHGSSGATSGRLRSLRVGFLRGGGYFLLRQRYRVSPRGAHLPRGAGGAGA